MNDPKIDSGALPVGTIIRSAKDGYLVEAVLGAGGFGITYKVLRLSDRTTCALKEYFPDKLCERGDNNTMSYLKTNAQTIEDGMADFITEARRLNKENIEHPNIVSIDEVFKANNTAYYVMEFIDGCNLRQYIRRNNNRPLTVEQALSVMRPVLQAVALIHRHRLAHLDLKHENIILTHEKDGSLRPVIIDFGQSKHYDKKGNATSKLTNAGCSDGFAPPEQYLGLYTFTPQADVYALCATLLYLLTARQPAKSSEINAGMISDMLDKNIPERVSRAIIAGMRRDKEDRTPSVSVLADELGLDISSQSHEGNVTRLLNLKGKRSFDSKRLVKPAVGVAIVLGLAGGVYWFANRPAPTASELLTEAIKEHDLKEIRRFADLDSVRAFIPCSELLISKEKFADGIQYAEKALATSDSVRAKELIDTANRLMAETKPSKQVGTQNDERQPAESDDVKFQRAQQKNDFNMLLSLAKSNYAKAFYPVALHYFNHKDNQNAKYWANKAISSKEDVLNSKKILTKIEQQDKQELTPSQNQQTSASASTNTKSKSQRLSEALAEKNAAKKAMVLSLLVQENYAPAYFYYAQLQIVSGNSKEAEQYLKKSIEAGVNVKQSQELLEILSE